MTMATIKETAASLSEFERAQLLIQMTQVSLLATIAAAADFEETNEATDRLNADLSRLTPNIAKWLNVGGAR
jgi:hypothetical protein